MEKLTHQKRNYVERIFERIIIIPSKIRTYVRTYENINVLFDHDRPLPREFFFKIEGHEQIFPLNELS